MALAAMWPKNASYDFALVTVRVYVLVVVPSEAVTTVVMVLGPTTKGRLADADPDVILVPFTFTVAAASLVVGVTVTDVMVVATFAV